MHHPCTREGTRTRRRRPRRTDGTISSKSVDSSTTHDLSCRRYASGHKPTVQSWREQQAGKLRCSKVLPQSGKVLRCRPIICTAAMDPTVPCYGSDRGSDIRFRSGILLLPSTLHSWPRLNGYHTSGTNKSDVTLLVYVLSQTGRHLETSSRPNG